MSRVPISVSGSLFLVWRCRSVQTINPNPKRAEPTQPRLVVALRAAQRVLSQTVLSACESVVSAAGFLLFQPEVIASGVPEGQAVAATS